MLSTGVRDGRVGAEEIAGLGERLAPAGFALDAAMSPALYDVLAPRLLADGDERPIRVLYAPCPCQPLGRGKRAPMLASEDREERLAATRLITETLSRARDLAAVAVVLPIAGRVALPDRDATLRRWFVEGHLDAGGRAVGRFKRWRAERTHVVHRPLDGLRFSLDVLALEAERRGVRLGIPSVARYDEIPTRDELLTLLGERLGAPLGVWLDTAAAHAKEVLGLGTQLDFVLALRSAAHAPVIIGVSISDAAGFVTGLPAGRGEIDLKAILVLLPDTAVRVLVCDSSTREDELESALSFVEAIPAAQ